MMIFESSFGIDFRKDLLVLTYLRRSFGKIRLVDSGSYPLLPESQKEERAAQSISLINSFISKHQSHRDRASISVPREKVVIRFLKFPAATRENLRRVLEYETSRFTPFEKGETYLDYQLLKEDKSWLYLMVVFIKKAEIDSILSLLRKVGIQPRSVQIPSVAALNLFFYHEGSKDGVPAVLVDVAEPFVELNLLKEKQWTESFHLPLPSGEKGPKIVDLLKRVGFQGDSLSKANFFVYGADADETFFSSLQGTPPIQEVSSPPLDRLDIGKGVSRPDRIYASIGLALRDLIKPQFSLNLLPVEMRKMVRQIGKPLFVVLALLALVLCITWGIGIYQQYKNAWSAANAELRKRKPEIEAVERLQKQKEALVKEVGEFEKIDAGETSKVEVLRELAQILPAAVWIWNFKYNGKEIEISGFADAGAESLIPLLDKSPLFEKVEFMGPITTERFRSVVGGNVIDRDKQRFKIKMRLEAKRSTP